MNPELLLQLAVCERSNPANVVRFQERVQPSAERRVSIGPRPDDDYFHAGSLHRLQQIEVQPLVELADEARGGLAGRGRGCSSWLGATVRDHGENLP